MSVSEIAVAAASLGAVGVAGVVYKFNDAVNKVADGVTAGLKDFSARQNSAFYVRERRPSGCDISQGLNKG